MKKFVVISFSLLALSACNKEPESLMSPCVGAKGSPCERTPINSPAHSFRA